MCKAATTLATFLTTPLRARLLVASLVGMVLVCGYPTARAESMPDQPTPAQIQKTAHVGTNVVIGMREWFVIGSERYKVLILQVTQVTSAAVVGKRLTAGSWDSRDEGEVTVPFEEIDTIEIEGPNKASFHEKFKCSLRLLPYAVVNPYTASASASDRCAEILFPPPHAEGLP